MWSVYSGVSLWNETPMKPNLFADWKGSDRPPLVSVGS